MKMDMSKVDLTNNNQKALAVVLMGAVLMGLWFLLPPLIVILTNLWIALVLAVPLIFIIMNPMLMWNIFKQLSWNLTKALVSGDKLGYMYRYHEYLLTKIDDLNKSVSRVTQARIGLERRIGELKQKTEDNKRKALAYEKQGAAPTVIRLVTNQIAVDTKQLEVLLPRATSILKQEEYLKQLHDAWIADATDLKYTLDAKAAEYKSMKEVSEALGNAKEFLKGNSKEYKIYQESLNQIEESVTMYTANLETFERQARPILDNIEAGKISSEEEGRRLLEEFKKGTVTLKLGEPA